MLSCQVECNKHHILHYSEYWAANKYNDNLKQSIGLIALMALEPHDAIHAECPAPPPLDPFTAQRVSKLYVPHPNPLQGIDNFRYAVDQAIRHPKTQEIEKQVAMLTIEAVTMQLPYIRQGLISDH